jgi:hypothetical protein
MGDNPLKSLADYSALVAQLLDQPNIKSSTITPMIPAWHQRCHITSTFRLTSSIIGYPRPT